MKIDIFNKFCRKVSKNWFKLVQTGSNWFKLVQTHEA